MNISIDENNLAAVKELRDIQSKADLTIWAQAEEIHEAHRAKNPSLPDFQYFYSWYINYGYVIKKPHSLIMAHETVDTWFIYLAIGHGSLIESLSDIPHYLPFMAWGYLNSKNNEKQIKIRTKRIFKLLGGIERWEQPHYH